MQPTVFQPAELRDENDNIIQHGTYGKNTPLCNDTNDAWIDYVMNNLEFLNKLAAAEIVPVATLPTSGDPNKKYLVTTGTDAGKLFFWTGSAWQETADSVSRAEAAAQRASASQNAAATNAAAAATSAQNASASASSASTKAGEARASATAAQNAADIATEKAAEVMEYTPEGYISLAGIIRGLAGLQFVRNSDDGGIDVYYGTPQEGG